MDGIELMQRVRAQSACGILILTGRAYVSDRVMGLELGADDYVLKPFEPRELVARVRSILRRLETAPDSSVSAQRQIAAFSGWQFNIGNNTLHAPNGEQNLAQHLGSKFAEGVCQQPQPHPATRTVVG